MSDLKKIGIVICDRYRSCAGGKCFRALRNKEGAFARYGSDVRIELVGYTSCGGCPGGNIEYTVDEMKANGAEVVHLATGLIVGYPPCPYIDYFKKYITEKYGVEVVFGTHPIPQKYYTMHQALQTWNRPFWEEIIQPTLADKKMRLAYD